MTTEMNNDHIANLRAGQDAEAEIRGAAEAAERILLADLSRVTTEELEELSAAIDGGDVPALARAILAADDQAQAELMRRATQAA